jgi:DNA-binding SARP family transcriptional activator
MSALWRIQLLGGLRIEGGERVLTRFRTRKTGVLLAYLAFYRRQAHPREVLIELLWPECEEASARHRLTVALSWLRQQLALPNVPGRSVLRADRYAVQLDPAAVTTDVAEFEAALEAASEAESDAEKSQFLAEAVTLYQGELLPGYYEEWCLEERAHLAEAYAGALRQWVVCLEKQGDPERALRYARRAVSLDPLREETHRELMRLLVAAGRSDAALSHYRKLEALLRRQLGEAPSPATRRLVDEIRCSRGGKD